MQLSYMKANPTSACTERDHDCGQILRQDAAFAVSILYLSVGADDMVKHALEVAQLAKLGLKLRGKQQHMQPLNPSCCGLQDLSMGAVGMIIRMVELALFGKI